MNHSFTRSILFCAVQFACSAASQPPELEPQPEQVAASLEVAVEAEPARNARRFVAASPRVGREYTDARWYFTNDDDLAAWYDLTYRLEDEFDALCGDTFCEGEYSNYQSLGIRCSVESKSGGIGSCVWTFAASLDEVNAATGHVKVSTQTWRCPLPVVRHTPATELLQSLGRTVDDALHVRLPRSEATIYDGVVNCL